MPLIAAGGFDVLNGKPTEATGSQSHTPIPDQNETEVNSSFDAHWI